MDFAQKRAQILIRAPLTRDPTGLHGFVPLDFWHQTQ